MELSVYNIEGADTGRRVVLEDDLFAIEPNEHAIYLDVKQYLANKRQGTHKAKEKWEVARTTKKLKRQKGTGGARAGSMKSPLFKGGARVFGPKPRDYSFKLNKKVKRLARLSAIADKLKNNHLMIVEDFNMEAPKTKTFLNILNNLKVADNRNLLVLDKGNEVIYKSGRNLPKTEIVTMDGLNTYQIMKAKSLLLSETSVKMLEGFLSK
jgi:large subunit ribosomal protein L4